MPKLFSSLLHSHLIAVIIPAYNEEKSIASVLADIPAEWVNEVVVVDNNSTDHTAVVATQLKATVLKESRQGYGSACLCGIAYLKEKNPQPDIVVFLDADYSDNPTELPELVNPILKDNYDMIIGSRALGNKQKGSMTLPQIWGNWLATLLLKWLYGARYTDLGPFRAIRFDKLLALQMEDKTYGWTVEMQLKASKKNYKVGEVPVSYKKRIGQSKISGTIKGVVLAGYKIISTIIKYR